MAKSRITELMAKKIGREASEQQLDELYDLLSKNPEYAYLHEVILSLKGSRNHFERDLPQEELVNHGWQHLADKLNLQPTSSDDPANSGKLGFLKKIIRKRRLWLAAACVAALLGCSIFFYKNYFGSHQLLAGKKIEEVHYGALSSLTLADGSKVWLNAGSKLIYPAKFSGTQREVTLEGEGFFEVTKNPLIPFLVHAGKITVKVLGTKFDVKAYSEDADIETTLISGKVQVVLNDDPEKEIVLSPHEKLTVIKPMITNSSNPQVSNELKYQVQALPVTANNNLTETAWVSNRLVLNNEAFENVAKLLERKYDVHVFFDNDKLKDEHVTGFFENENIKEVLEVLKMTTHFKYRVDGNNVHLY
jgi:transmembrane sensor